MRPAIEVTQADREAAKRYFREADTSDVFHGTELAEAFARRRLAEREAVVKWLRMLGIMRAMQNPSQLADAIEAGEPFK